MNNDRIKELQDISNEFLRRLGKDEDEINLSIKKPLKTEINEDTKTSSNISNIRKLNIPDFSLTRLYKKQSEKKESLVKINY